LKRKFFLLMLRGWRAVKSRFRRFVYVAQGYNLHRSVAIGRVSIAGAGNVVIGPQTTIEDYVIIKVLGGIDLPGLQVGKHCFIGAHTVINCCLSVRIHDNVMIAAGCQIVDTDHGYRSPGLISEQNTRSEEIIIGEGAWIAGNSTILRGVTIGPGSVVGAGSVVTKSIPEFEVWAGVPARFLCRRFATEATSA
jgi:acetyltransferase-like isoleucine patch superfamily enzyme